MVPPGEAAVLDTCEADQFHIAVATAVTVARARGPSARGARADEAGTATAAGEYGDETPPTAAGAAACPSTAGGTATTPNAPAATRQPAPLRPCPTPPRGAS